MYYRRASYASKRAIFLWRPESIARRTACSSPWLTADKAAPEMRARLFQEFQRGDATRAGGIGFGLSIIGGFVRAQGGEVEAGENPGGGAVLTVYLRHRTHENPPNK
jgi:hypothetical protein